MTNQIVMWIIHGLRIAAEIALIWGISHTLGFGFW